MLPFALSSLASGIISLNRMSKFLSSEELEDPYLLDPTSKDAVSVDGDFTWEAVKKPKVEDEKKKDSAEETQSKKKGKSAKGSDKEKLPSNSNDLNEKDEKEPEEAEELPYELKDLKFSIPKGSFVGIVGRIGSGKVRSPHLDTHVDD